MDYSIIAIQLTVTDTSHSRSTENESEEAETGGSSGEKDDSNTGISTPVNGIDEPEDPEENETVETYLTSLTEYEKNKYIEIGEDYEKDNWENEYKQGANVFATNDGFSSGRGFVEYVLNGDYKTLKGTLYVPFESRNKQFKSSPMFRIYGDDQLLYSGPAIEGKDKPVDFAINVEDVCFLKILIQGGWYEGDGTGLIPCICVGNLILSTESDASITKDTSLPKLYLTDLSYYDKSSLYGGPSGYLQDIEKNKYYRGDVIANSESTGFVEYHIDGKYSTLKGTVYVPWVSRGQNYKQEPCANIYIDDELKETITLGSKDSPIGFSLDIPGAEFIKIEVCGGWYRGDGTGLIPGICVADLCLY